MRIPLLLARTYLFSIKQRSFISFINVLAFLGLLIGIASLICVTSIFNGFRLLVRDMLLTIDPHIRVTLNEGIDSKVLKERVNKYVDIYEFNESSSSKIIIGYREVTQAGMILGIESLHKYVKKSDDKVAIGIGLADKLGIKKGDTISLSTPEMIDLAISGMALPTGIQVVIDSIFQISSGVQYDNSFIMADLHFLQSNGLVGQRFADIRIDNPDNVYELTKTLKSDRIIGELQIDTWKDLHHELYSTMEFERNMSFIILGIISFVSAFNILIAMWMMVKSKSKDIAMLLSMGASQQDIKWTFMLQGMTIGSMGSILGAGLGVLLCYGQKHYGWISLPNSIVPTMPVSLSYDIVLISVILGISVSSIAGIYPSILATRTNISEQLRHE
jgi:lipoprotein-releasing system permease protein